MCAATAIWYRRTPLTARGESGYSLTTPRIRTAFHATLERDGTAGAFSTFTTSASGSCAAYFPSSSSRVERRSVRQPMTARHTSTSFKYSAPSRKAGVSPAGRGAAHATRSSRYGAADCVPHRSAAAKSAAFGLTDEGTAAAAAAASGFLIPPARKQDVGKMVVVLDLDETLVASRDGRIYERPGVGKLLQTLKGHCEVIVWTAGAREYALDAIQRIDPYCAIQHCVYRHPMWWTGDQSRTKNLRLLGRPMDNIIIIDNTANVLRVNPQQSILVRDFNGPSSLQSDRTLLALAEMFEQVFRSVPYPAASDVLGHRMLTKCSARVYGDQVVEMNTLSEYRTDSLRSLSSARVSPARNGR